VVEIQAKEIRELKEESQMQLSKIHRLYDVFIVITC
jgi:hypothetical protein